MAIEHVDITDPEIHEPKGASTAVAKRVWVTDGAGSGTYQRVQVTDLDVSPGIDGDVFVISGGVMTPIDITSLISGSFSGMSIVENTQDTTITDVGVFEFVDSSAGWELDEENNVIFDADHLVIPTTGIYHLTGIMSFSGAGGGEGDEFAMSLAINTAPNVIKQISHATVKANGFGGMAVTGYVSLTIGDFVSMAIANDTSTSNPTVVNATVSANLLQTL